MFSSVCRERGAEYRGAHCVDPEESDGQGDAARPAGTVRADTRCSCESQIVNDDDGTDALHALPLLLSSCSCLHIVSVSAYLDYIAYHTSGLRASYRAVRMFPQYLRTQVQITGTFPTLREASLTGVIIGPRTMHPMYGDRRT